MSPPKRKLILPESVRKGESKEAFKQRVAEKLRQQGLLKPTKGPPPGTAR